MISSLMGEIISPFLERYDSAGGNFRNFIGSAIEVLSKCFARLLYLHSIAQISKSLHILMPSLVPVQTIGLYQRRHFIPIYFEQRE